MKKIIKLQSAVTLIEKYEHQNILKQQDVQKLNKKIVVLEGFINIIRHYISRLDRIKLRFLED